jgi:hyperosmotically inducible protein
MTTTTLITRLLAAAALSAASMTAVYAAEPQNDAAMAGAAKAGTASAEDAAITTKIKAALGDLKKVDVTTADGVVVLSGSVPNTDVGTKAIQVASAVPGVKEVKSELTVMAK